MIEAVNDPKYVHMDKRTFVEKDFRDWALLVTELEKAALHVQAVSWLFESKKQGQVYEHIWSFKSNWTKKGSVTFYGKHYLTK